MLSGTCNFLNTASLLFLTTTANTSTSRCATIATTASFIKVPNLLSRHHQATTMSSQTTSSPSSSSCTPLNGNNNNNPKKSCIPCECLDKSHILPTETILSELQTLPLWKIKRDETHHDHKDDCENDAVSKITKISKNYVAKNFSQALESINAIGRIAERENHHPDIHLTGYRNVEIVLYTHSIGGVSANDLSLARMIEEEVGCKREFYSPKWLRENGVGEGGTGS